MAESNATQVILTDDGIKIIKAQNTADNAAGGVTNLNDPNLMSVIEKQNNITQFAGLTSQYNVLVQNAKDDGIDTTAVTTAYNNLNKFMADVLVDPDHASDIDRVTYKKYQDAYNEELAKIQSALQNNANNKFASASNATSQVALVASQAFIQAQSAVDYANSETAVQSAAIDKAQSAASDAVSAANSTASEFGKVDQKADSAVASALNAQKDASSAVEQASSAAADSKDAQQIAGAVSQSYKTLTDGSTMTIAELENGLATKLTKTDLGGYATQTWAQNQINTTADGINATISSVKDTIDGHDTSINELKADSSGFKAQFTKVNGTLDKHTTDIGTLQASSKEFSSTITTVQTQIQDSAVGINLAFGTNQEYSMGYGIPTTTWKDGYAYENLPTTVSKREILPQNPHTFYYTLIQGTTYTQTIWFETDATVKDLSAAQITWYTSAGHDGQPATLINLGENKYKIYSTYMWPGKSDNNVRLFDIFSLNCAFDLSTGTYLKFGKLKLEKGSLSTDWCLNSADTATQSQITQLSHDINLRVTEKGLIDQINIQAGKTLISSSGQLTLAANTIYFDTNNPVIIPSANIDSLLVGKKLTAANISANTFSTNNETFTVDKDGAITAKNMTLIGGTLTSPTINASTINGSTINGTTFNGGNRINNSNNTTGYYPMTITPDGAYRSTYFDSAVGLQSSVESGAITYKYRSMIGNGQYSAYDSVINGQGFQSQSGYTSGKDTTFSNTETITGYVNVTPSTGIYLYGPTQKINFAGNSDNMGSDGITMDSYGNLYGQPNSAYWRIRDSNGNDIANFGIDTANQRDISFSRNTSIGNLFLGVGHTIGMLDKKPLYFKQGDSRGNMLDIKAGAVHYTSLVKSSLLSVKKDVQKADTSYWAQLVNSIDLATYQYKTDDNTSHIRLSSIVDDVNDTKQWRLPDVFVSRDEDGKLCGVDDSVLLNATLATVQEQQKQIDQLNGHLLELEAKLNG
ncbi:phage tail protein [Lactiplantibacillus pentosus]|uniref:phage tail protein n=1 Tax=Lactiplantibacillus pentosus TaxID=1589 RepID=UPI003F5372AC